MRRTPSPSSSASTLSPVSLLEIFVASIFSSLDERRAKLSGWLCLLVALSMRLVALSMRFVYWSPSMRLAVVCKTQDLSALCWSPSVIKPSTRLAVVCTENLVVYTLLVALTDKT